MRLLEPYLSDLTVHVKACGVLRDSAATMNMMNATYVDPIAVVEEHSVCLPVARVCIEGPFGAFHTEAAVYGSLTLHFSVGSVPALTRSKARDLATKLQYESECSDSAEAACKEVADEKTKVQAESVQASVRETNPEIEEAEPNASEDAEHPAEELEPEGIALTPASMEVSKLDYLCYNCFTHFTKQITLQSSELSVDSFMPPEEAIEDLNRSARSTFVSPLRPPSEVRRRDRPAYVKRKQTELEQVVTENLRSRMRLAYDENVASGSSEQKCSTCTEWADNIRRAFATTASPRERCQLLTLLPSTLTRNEVQKIIPEASIYIINRSRKLREDHGVWYVPDPYTRCKKDDIQDGCALVEKVQ
ncbi:hypothetical protein HPB47_027134 [Ixodes persulcatus]|uniref:Uncharacterized protein n=1 Tax=Ixodes persulcatus TaxID=34615 RepID=A0AC60PY55_IXOPE|nr:hypothetical protein HPB47_027134 [Ixodes persulcatus]